MKTWRTGKTNFTKYLILEISIKSIGGTDGMSNGHPAGAAIDN